MKYSVNYTEVSPRLRSPNKIITTRQGKRECAGIVGTSELIDTKLHQLFQRRQNKLDKFKPEKSFINCGCGNMSQNFIL